MKPGWTEFQALKMQSWKCLSAQAISNPTAG
jgi:hypothetical protein